MGLPGEVLHQVSARLGGGVQDQILPVGVRQTGLVAQPGHQLQEDRGALPDAVHLLQVLHRRGQHTGEGPVAIHQGMGDGIGVPPGDGVVEQQLQRLVVRKAVQPAPQEPLPHLLPVPVVDAHGYLLPAAASGSAIFI